MVKTIYSTLYVPMEKDDGSQFLNDSGERIEIERTDRGKTSNDGEENVRALRKSGEVY